MILPVNISMETLMFMDGTNGYALQQYGNKKFGVRVSKERANRGSPFIETWSLQGLPNQVFKSYKELRDAAIKIKKGDA